MSASLTITEPTGRVTFLSYDSSHRILGITDLGGHSYTFTYSGDDLAGYCNPDGGCRAYTYDSSGRLLTKADPMGNAVTYAYDSQGQFISATSAESGTDALAYPSYHEMTSMTRPDGGVWTYVFDWTNARVVSRTDPAGNIVLTVTDASGVTTYTYDTSEPGHPDNTQTTYEYDAHGNPLSVTDPTGAKIELFAVLT